MSNEKNEQGRKCFIITPIGNDNSDIFRKAKGVIESVIKPVLEKYGFDDIKPAYEINSSGMINTQIINRIIDDDLVIANLTGNNPNVMYELCLRHVVAKPIIHICEKNTSLPFDIKDSRTLFYENDMLGVDELKSIMRLFMEEISYEDECMDNPVYSAYRMGKLLRETQGTEENKVLQLLLHLSGQVSELNNNAEKVTYDSSIGRNESKYAIQEMRKEIGLIDEELTKSFLNNNSFKKMRVHELATMLNTSPFLLLRIADVFNMGIKSAMSTIGEDEAKKIVNYICDFSER